MFYSYVRVMLINQFSNCKTKLEFKYSLLVLSFLLGPVLSIYHFLNFFISKNINYNILSKM